MITKKTAKRDIMVDAFKGIACIMIILIHRPLPGVTGGIVKALGRAAVAFFFLTSGYYAWGTDREQVEKTLLRRCGKLIRLTACALGFYLVWEAALRFAGTGAEKVVQWLLHDVFTWKTLYWMAVWDEDPLAGHMWFLFALIRVYLIVWVLYKLRIEKVMTALPVILWTLAYILEFYPVDFDYYRNGWVYGMAFFSAGYIFASGRFSVFKEIKKKYLVLLCVLGALCTIIEYLAFDEYQMYLGTILLSCGAFLLALQLKPEKGRTVNALAELGLKYSTAVYILHWAVKEVSIKFDKELACSSAVWYQWLVPVLVVVISVTGSVIWCKLYRKVRSSILNKREKQLL